MRLYGRSKEADARTAGDAARGNVLHVASGGDKADRREGAKRGRRGDGRGAEGDVPPGWDDVLLPDDQLPVGVPAAARGVGPVQAGDRGGAAAAAHAAGPERESAPVDAGGHDGASGRTDTARNDLLLMTCLGAADGTILLLAATGKLASLTLAIVVGLTVVSGIGAWIAAYAAFGGRHRGRRDYTVLARMAGISITATVGAAWLGVAIGEAVTFHILPKTVGVVLFLVAAEIWGLRLPRVAHIPLPLAAVAAAGILEAVLWIP